MKAPYIKPHRRQPRDAIRRLLQSFLAPAKPDKSINNTIKEPQKRAF